MFSSSYTKLWALSVAGLGTEVKIFGNAFVGAATKETGESLTGWEVLTEIPVRIQSSGYNKV
jgi:hypothetical protein